MSPPAPAGPCLLQSLQDGASSVRRFIEVDILVASGALQSTLSAVQDGLEQPQIMEQPLDTGKAALLHQGQL